jgi:OmpA-OmpF porin, OOP family
MLLLWDNRHGQCIYLNKFSVMKFIRSSFAPIIILCALVALQSCKAKKLAQKPVPPAPVTQPAAPVQQTKPVTAPVQQPAPPAPKPDYNFSNIQFEFNSSVLKTASYPVLDKAATNMKMDPSVKFNVNGYASIEGTAEHNMILSQDRANSVKVYLVNSGVSSTQLTATGYGTSNPVGDNSTEDGRVLNRRVEIHKAN